MNQTETPSSKAKPLFHQAVSDGLAHPLSRVLERRTAEYRRFVPNPALWGKSGAIGRFGATNTTMSW